MYCAIRFNQIFRLQLNSDWFDKKQNYYSQCTIESLKLVFMIQWKWRGLCWRMALLVLEVFYFCVGLLIFSVLWFTLNKIYWLKLVDWKKWNELPYNCVAHYADCDPCLDRTCYNVNIPRKSFPNIPRKSFPNIPWKSFPNIPWKSFPNIPRKSFPEI